MKVNKKENGIELIAETAWEQECIDSIAGKTLAANHEDTWDSKGPVTITYESHPWDRE